MALYKVKVADTKRTETLRDACIHACEIILYSLIVQALTSPECECPQSPASSSLSASCGGGGSIAGSSSSSSAPRWDGGDDNHQESQITNHTLI